jgi:hypothetical protein
MRSRIQLHMKDSHGFGRKNISTENDFTFLVVKKNVSKKPSDYGLEGKMTICDFRRLSTKVEVFG